MERLSSLPSIIEKPSNKPGGPGSGGADNWIVTVFDNDYNTADQVVLILIKATHCSLSEAQMETWEVHHLGKSVVHHGEEDECTKVANVISEIGIRVEVSEE